MAIETALTLVALTSGYSFARICPPSAYSAVRERGHNIYFRSVFYAVVMLVAATIVCIAAYCTYPKFLPGVNVSPVTERRLMAFIFELISFEPFRYAIYISSLALAVVLALLVKGFFSIFPPLHRMILLRVIRNNEFEVLVYRSASKNPYPYYFS